jgi:hypothetical protein
MRITLLVLILSFISYTASAQTVSTEILDFGSFTMDAPHGWTKIKLQGVDDFVGRIAIDKQDTLNFNLGFFANSMEQHDEPEDYYGDNPEKFSKSKVLQSIINGRKAKILTPKKHGIGMTGVYFDSLWRSGQDIVKFNLVGHNLKKENESAVLKAIQTLQFRQSQ